jgi:hypothetical protein
MSEQFGECFKILGKNEACINAADVVAKIKTLWPQETNSSLAKRAGVHVNTISRWLLLGRSDAKAMKRLLLSFSTFPPEKVLLTDATAFQLKKQCEKVGWKNVIDSSE